jgi:exonuclease III
LQSLCEDCDVLLLQETWLNEQELGFLNTVHQDFYGRGISSIKCTEGILRGRPYGGLGVLWRKSLGSACKVSELDDDRLLKIDICHGNRTITLLNVYLPYDDGSNLQEYQQYVSKIDSIISDNPYTCAIGDFNANIKDSSSRFGNELIHFCRSENLVISDRILAPNDSFTFFSEAHGSVAWLDHIVSTNNLHSIIDDICVKYDYISSDHFPLLVKINIGNVNVAVNSEQSEKHQDFKHIRWDNISDTLLDQYKEQCAAELSRFSFNHDLLLCDDVLCNDETHKRGIDLFYNSILVALHNTSAILTEKESKPYKPVAGWDDVCAELHAHARNAFLLWVSSGKPRFGEKFDLMKNSRAQFKRALRDCKENVSKHTSDSIATKLLKHDSKTFWKEIKKVINKDQPKINPETIDGYTGEKHILEMWKNHFSSLLNTAKSHPLIINPDNDSYDRFTAEEVFNAISDLKSGKTCGLDGVYAEHLKHVNKKLSVILSLCFNAMLIHNYLPDVFMKTIIVPIVKDKKGDISSSDNFRPIAITCVISKVFEIIILKRHSAVLETTGNQFGFKHCHGTEHSIFTLKQVIDFYSSHCTPVYLCFIDLSKAFDRVDHSILFTKLLRRNVPVLIVRLLQTWYCSQTFVIRWNKCISSPFTVSNGVRQGGILSPILFNVFIDDLSLLLRNSLYGCHINGDCFNHIVYADDTVLLATSPVALQNLINICLDFIDEHHLAINKRKTKCMVVLPKELKEIHIPAFYIRSSPILQVVQEKYLGVIITSSQDDDETILKEMRSLYARGNIVLKKFKKCSDHVKVQLFKSYCSSFYCCSLWSSYTNSRLKSMRVAFNNIFRSLFSVSRRDSVSQNLLARGISCFNVIRRKQIFSFYTRVLSSSNSLIKTLCDSPFFTTSKIFRKWECISF